MYVAVWVLGWLSGAVYRIFLSVNALSRIDLWAIITGLYELSNIPCGTL